MITIRVVEFAVALAALGGFGAYIATQKGRHPLEGVLFGMLLGLPGLLLEVLLPAGAARPATPEPEAPRPGRDAGDMLRRARDEPLDEVNWLKDAEARVRRGP